MKLLLQKSVINHYVLQKKTERKIFDQKRFMKNLFKISEKNKSGVLRINQIN